MARLIRAPAFSSTPNINVSAHEIIKVMIVPATILILSMTIPRKLKTIDRLRLARSANV